MIVIHCFQIKLLKLNVTEVQRNIITLPSFTNQRVFPLFNEILIWYFVQRLEGWKHNSIIKENNCIKVLDWGNLKQQVDLIPYQDAPRGWQICILLPLRSLKGLLDNSTSENQKETAMPILCLFAKGAKKDFWLIEKDWPLTTVILKGKWIINLGKMLGYSIPFLLVHNNLFYFCFCFLCLFVSI